MIKMKKYFVCCLCAVMACSLTACGDKKKGVRDAAEYQTMVVSKKDMMLTQPYSARLTGRQIVEIRPQVTGNITRILTAEGKTVRKGQTLFIIDQTPFQAALEVAIANRQSAEAKLSTAKMNYDSQLKLKEGSVVSDFSVETTRHELLEAQAALVQAQAQEKNARWQLSCTEVKSPVDGVASMIPWHVGALVGSNISEPLVTVADDSQMYAYFSVTERAVINLIDRYGSTADFINKAPSIKLRLASGTEYPVEGRIDAVSGTVDAQTGAVTLRATFANPQHLLRDGGSATVLVPSDHKDCIVIPQEATYELQNRTFVYRVVDGKTKATAVTLFPQNNGKEYIVEEGLNVGDTIIAEGAGLLKDGIEIGGKKHERKNIH
jgi:membrane fusion protein (multidrug efflux system)